MRLRFGLLAVCLFHGLLMTPPATAQNAMPPAFPVGWSAEAKGLDAVTNRLPLPCGINRIQGRIKLSAPQRRPQIVPATGLDLIAAGTAVEKVMLHIEDDGAGHPMLMLNKQGGAKAVDGIHIPVSIAYGRDIAFALAWDAGGRISVTAEGKQASMMLGTAPAAVEFFVQGGKGDVSDARFDWQGPPAPGCAAPR